MSRIKKQARKCTESIDAVYVVADAIIPKEDRVKDALFSHDRVLWVRTYETFEEAQAAADRVNAVAPMPFLIVETVYVPVSCRADDWCDVINNLRNSMDTDELFGILD